jgi:hypothetical protein
VVRTLIPFFVGRKGVQVIRPLSLELGWKNYRVPDVADTTPYMLLFIRILENTCVIPVNCALMFIFLKVCKH